MKKTIRDNVLGTIIIENELISQLINSKEVRRLQRISQLGITHHIFPSSTHTRFAHSLGAYDLARRFLDHLSPEISKATYEAILSAALLHDIGHGPLSHLFELISPIEHEEYSKLLILDEKTEVNKILSNHNANLPTEICLILSNKHPLKWINQLISSEIDVDRLDYLKRDSITLGLNYGNLDSDRFIEKSMIVDNKLVFKEVTLEAMENLLLGRYHMWQTVYESNKNVAYSEAYKFFFNRLNFLIKKGVKFNKDLAILEEVLNHKKIPYEKFIKLDDYYVLSLMSDLIGYDNILDTIINIVVNGKEPTIKVLSQEEVGDFEKENDPKTRDQSWTVVNIKKNFIGQKTNIEKESLILVNDKVVPLTAASEIILNTRNSELKLRNRIIGIII